MINNPHETDNPASLLETKGDLDASEPQCFC